MIELRVEHLQRMMIPELYYNCRLSQIPDELCPHKKVIRKYIDNIEMNLVKGRGLLLYGEYSQGKSGLGSILLKAAAAHCQIGLWIRSDNIPGYVIDGTMFDKDFTMYERALEVPLLVIDELIIGETSRKADVYVEGLIRQRVNERQATIVTTNIAPKDLEKRFPALTAVMKEALFPVRVFGYDFRSKIAGEITHELS